MEVTKVITLTSNDLVLEDMEYNEVYEIVKPEVFTKLNLAPASVVYYPGAELDVLNPLYLYNYNKLIIIELIDMAYAGSYLNHGFRQSDKFIFDPPLVIQTEVKLKDINDMNHFWYAQNMAIKINIELGSESSLTCFERDRMIIEFKYKAKKRIIDITFGNYNTIIPNERFDVYYGKGAPVPEGKGWENILINKPSVILFNLIEIKNKYIKDYIKIEYQVSDEYFPMVMTFIDLV